MDWKDVAAKITPMLGTALGGPLGGIAAQEISQAILGKPSGTEKEIAQAMASLTPDGLQKLKEAENAFAIKMKELDIEVDKLNADDRKDARKSMTDNHSFWPLFITSTVILIATFSMEGYAMLVGLPPGVDDLIVGRVLGTLDSASALVLSYWYGSSIGSAKKDDILAKK